MLERGEIQVYRLTQEGREVLEWDRARMPSVDGLQGCQRWYTLTVVANPLEVGIQVKLLFRLSLRHKIFTFHSRSERATIPGEASASL